MAKAKAAPKKKKEPTNVKKLYTTYVPGVSGSILEMLSNIGFYDLKKNKESLAKIAQDEVDFDWCPDSNDEPRPDTYYEVEVSISLSEPKKLPKKKPKKPKTAKVEW